MVRASVFFTYNTIDENQALVKLTNIIMKNIYDTFIGHLTFPNGTHTYTICYTYANTYTRHLSELWIIDFD